MVYTTQDHQRQKIGLHVEKCDGTKPPTFNIIYNSEATVLIILGKKQHTIDFPFPASNEEVENENILEQSTWLLFLIVSHLGWMHGMEKRYLNILFLQFPVVYHRCMRANDFVALDNEIFEPNIVLDFTFKFHDLFKFKI
ncbi:hypothetical protein Bhyg_00864 [Pseudolycoriella hygida]|uniref:Uncharacterized protein n=1 Tax=Pseudolycoriella hygida TaxID=35572 RepID=A0A9Q0N964_9DIPT|nr:hypothetical protein Bhyg_00864 [Pseudolycoriella hygida]